MLWDKHLFIRNMTESLTGSAACLCPHVPEVAICASTAQTAQKEASSRPGCTPGGGWGGGTLTQVCLTQQTPHRRDKQLRVCAELPCSICTGFYHCCILLLAWK